MSWQGPAKGTGAPGDPDPARFHRKDTTSTASYTTAQIDPETADAPEFLFTDIAATHLKDVSLPVVLAEGAGNTAALAEVASYEMRTDRPRFVAIGLTDGWERWPALEKVEWKDPPASGGRCRAVTLALDRYADKELVHMIACRLRDLGGVVSIFAWPDYPPVDTIAALIEAVGPRSFRNLLEVLTSQLVHVKAMADAVMACEHFAKDAGGMLYRFEGGNYCPTGAEFVSRRIKDVMEVWEAAASWSRKLVNEVEAYILADAPRLWPTPPRDVINVRNGLLDVYLRVLKPHSPDHLSSVQLPVTYDPAAECPMWELFVEKVFPADAQHLAYQLVAWLMVPDTSLQKAVLLLGEGANGKSTYVEAVRDFLGAENCAAMPLQRLVSDKFSVSHLVGKLADLVADLPATHLIDTSVFKALVGGDTLTAERKFQPPFDFIPFCRLIFSANEAPRTDDATHGYFRKWQAIPFDAVFKPDDPGTIPPDVLHAALTLPGELSGLLNRALAELPALASGGFTQSKSTREALEEFCLETNPVTAFLAQYTVDDPEGYVTKARLLEVFNQDRVTHRRPVMSAKAFGAAIKRLGKYEEGQREQGTWVWNGLRLKRYGTG